MEKDEKFELITAGEIPEYQPKKEKKKFIVRCEFCEQEILKPNECIGSRPDTACYYCKKKKNLKNAPVHMLCDDCFLRGHKNTKLKPKVANNN